jgi:hypothetical protein
MKNQQRQLVVLGATATAVAFFFIGREIYRKIRLEEILKQMSSASTGDISADLGLVFSGQPYLNQLAGKRLILLQESVAKKYATELQKYVCQTYICNTNEGGIYGVFNRVNNKAQVAQISKWYKALFGRDLLADLNADLNDVELEKVRTIVASKPDYEIAQ